jgi:hypothetical protein
MPYSSSDKILPFFFHRISGDGLPDAKHFNWTVVPSGWITLVGSVWLPSLRERNSGASRIKKYTIKILWKSIKFDLHSMNQYPNPWYFLVRYSMMFDLLK